MNKKVAILVGGMFREFEYARPTWKFLDNLDYDMFVSTWTTTESNPQIGIFEVEDVSIERIRAVESNAIISLEPMKRINTHSGPMMYHWKRLFQMVRESDVDYDAIILTRTDITLLELQTFSEYIENIRRDRVYALGPIEFKEPPENLFLADCMFLGKSEIMFEAFEDLEYCHPGIGNIHKHMALHFLNSNIYIESMSDIVKYAVMRRASRGQKIGFC